MVYKPPQVVTLYNDDHTSSCKDTPPVCYQPLTSILDTRPLLQPLNHGKYHTKNKHDEHDTLFGSINEPDGGTVEHAPLTESQGQKGNRKMILYVVMVQYMTYD
jgi:hypothetical protein